jgi:glucose/mannose-6-phosphate isomerase
MSMFDDVLGLPGQFRWGTGTDAAPIDAPGPIVLLGMGGSAMAATVAMLAADGRVPVVVHRGYGLPTWAVRSGALVVAVSYSGNTEEVLSGVEEALDAGLVVASIASGGRLARIAADRGLPHLEVPGGLQPRAGVGYQAAAVVATLAAAGRIEEPDAVLTETADVLDRLLGDGDGAAVVLGRQLAEALGSRTPVVYGGLGVGATAAYRWKTQINENAKRPAFAGVVPEMNHNELEGWSAASSETFGLVYLRDEHDHPRIARRLDLLDTVLSGSVARIGEVRSSGEGPLARFFSLAIVGDVASVAVAGADGVDPTPVETLESFKTMLTKGTP